MSSQRSSLGKGLGAILPDLLKDISDRPAYMTCGIEELRPGKYQSRKNFDPREMKSLSASIKKNGLIQPILVRGSESGYEIIAGERRWRAAQEAGLKSVPILVRDAEDVLAAELSLIENLQRADLNPIEEAEAYQALLEQLGLSQDEISARVGKDRSTITNSLRLLRLPAEVRAAIIRKELSAGHARPLLALNSAQEQTRIARDIIEKGLTVRETELLVNRLKKAPVSAGPKVSPYRDLESFFSTALMTRVRIRGGKRGGSIEIKFHSNDDLERLTRIITNSKG